MSKPSSSQGRHAAAPPHQKAGASHHQALPQSTPRRGRIVQGKLMQRGGKGHYYHHHQKDISSEEELERKKQHDLIKKEMAEVLKHYKEQEVREEEKAKFASNRQTHMQVSPPSKTMNQLSDMLKSSFHNGISQKGKPTKLEQRKAQTKTAVSELVGITDALREMRAQRSERQGLVNAFIPTEAATQQQTDVSSSKEASNRRPLVGETGASHRTLRSVDELDHAYPDQSHPSLDLKSDLRKQALFRHDLASVARSTDAGLVAKLPELVANRVHHHVQQVYTIVPVHNRVVSARNARPEVKTIVLNQTPGLTEDTVDPTYSLLQRATFWPPDLQKQAGAATASLLERSLDSEETHNATLNDATHDLSQSPAKQGLRDPDPDFAALVPKQGLRDSTARPMADLTQPQGLLDSATRPMKRVTPRTKLLEGKLTRNDDSTFHNFEVFSPRSFSSVLGEHSVGLRLWAIAESSWCGA